MPCHRTTLVVFSASAETADIREYGDVKVAPFGITLLLYIRTRCPIVEIGNVNR